LYNDVYTLLKSLLECFTKCFTKCFYSCCFYSVGSWHAEAISRYRRRRRSTADISKVTVERELPDHCIVCFKASLSPNAWKVQMRGPTKSRPEPSEAVRTPSGCRPEPSGTPSGSVESGISARNGCGLIAPAYWAGGKMRICGF